MIMDSIFNILENKDFDEPPEIARIKKYVQDRYGVNVGVRVRQKDIIISVPDASLAGTLRMLGPDIKKVCKIDKRLTYQIVS
jgi:hypothetical protein